MLYEVITVNPAIAERVYRHMVLEPRAEETYLFDPVSLTCYRINWDAPPEAFPETVPGDLPDIIFQMGSGLYGIRDAKGRITSYNVCYTKLLRLNINRDKDKHGTYCWCRPS